jgi:uncharacterized UBP type Zn finger protein
MSIEAMKQAQAQEPVAWMTNSEQETTAEYLFSHMQTPIHDIPLYTTPPKREWVGLTDEEIAEAVGSPLDEVYLADFRKVEAKLKEKNA